MRGRRCHYTIERLEVSLSIGVEWGNVLEFTVIGRLGTDESAMSQEQL